MTNLNKFNKAHLGGNGLLMRANTGLLMRANTGLLMRANTGFTTRITGLSTMGLSTIANRWNKDFNPRLDLIIRNQLALQQSPSRLAARNLSVSSGDNNIKEVKNRESKFDNYINKFKQKFLTKLNIPKLNDSSYKALHYTIDLETYNNEGKATPYLMGVYSPDGVFKPFYGKGCMSYGFKYLLNLKPLNTKDKELIFYAHNGGNFDHMFIAREAMKCVDISEISMLKDGGNSMFMLSFKYKAITFTFKDSIKILPISLSSAIKNFNIEVDSFRDKLPFNHNWVNKENINYKGDLPDWLVGYEDNLIDMGVYKGGIFDFKKYATIYNKVDTVALHKVIEEYYRILFKLFNIDLTNILTLPSICLKLFRSRFYDFNKDKIHLLNTNEQNMFSQAYYGAATMVIKPKASKGYYYDINSLYPHAMKSPMPVGRPEWYDIRKGLDDLFGIVLAEVNMPLSVKYPSLPHRININGTDKLIFPHGKWIGFFWSEELKYALSQGCEIKLIQAWEFKKSLKLFHKYIDMMYESKRTADKGLRLVFKLFLNALYGKMAQRREYVTSLLTKDRTLIEDIENKYTNVKTESMGGGWIWAEYNSTPNKELYKQDRDLFDKMLNENKRFCESRPCSMAIAVSITANARVELFKTINKMSELGIEILYMDTDALVLNKPMPKEYLGDGLGQFKNELADCLYTLENDSEYYMVDPIFLRDKVYGYKTRDDNIKIKFSGYKKSMITNDLYLEMKQILNNEKNNIQMSCEYIRKNLTDLSIGHHNEDRVFTFNYDKRVKVFENGLWVDTKPLIVGMDDKLKSKLNINNNRVESPDNKISVKYNEPTEMNIYNIKNNDYKEFDGYYLAYSKTRKHQPVLNEWESLNGVSLNETDLKYMDTDERYIAEYTSYLSTLIKKAMDEGILKVGVRFLITEGYTSLDNDCVKYRTIGRLRSFENPDDLIALYKQHIHAQLEYYTSNNKVYAISELHLRLKIPHAVLSNGMTIFKQDKCIFKINK